MNDEDFKEPTEDDLIEIEEYEKDSVFYVIRNRMDHDYYEGTSFDTSTFSIKGTRIA